MHDVFDSIRGLLKVDSLSVDNKIFQMHYKVTMFFLLACSLLVTQRQYFGDPIDCIVETVDQEVMDTYCWIHATFTIPEMNGAVVGHEVAHPGIANPNVPGEEKREIKHHKYYQWVTLVLAIQALFFYVPRYLWKMWEGGKIKMLVMQLDSPIVDDDVKKERKDMLVSYFRMNMNNHNFYAFKYFSCEVLNFINVIAQIYVTDAFLGHSFSRYGREVIEFSQQEITSRDDPMDRVFPKVAKCTFHMSGASGSLEKHDGLCVLPLNIFNEKIYIFLWFWFIIVAVITAVGLLYRIATFLPGFRQILLKTKSRLASSGTVEAVTRRCEIGDWFLLYQLDMDPRMNQSLQRLLYLIDGLLNALRCSRACCCGEQCDVLIVEREEAASNDGSNTADRSESNDETDDEAGVSRDEERIDEGRSRESCKETDRETGDGSHRYEEVSNVESVDDSDKETEAIKDVGSEGESDESFDFQTGKSTEDEGSDEDSESESDEDSESASDEDSDTESDEDSESASDVDSDSESDEDSDSESDEDSDSESDEDSESASDDESHSERDEDSALVTDEVTEGGYSNDGYNPNLQYSDPGPVHSHQRRANRSDIVETVIFINDSAIFYSDEEQIFASDESLISI